MPTSTDFRKTLTDPTPLYFAAGVIEKVRAEAPERIAKVRATDPKAVQERLQSVLTTLDSDFRKLRDQAQHYALQGVGYAAEYAVKAKESYDSLAEQGKNAVESWRGQDDADTAGVVYETTIEREPVTVTEPGGGQQSAPKNESGTTGTAPRAGSGSGSGSAQKTQQKTEQKTGQKTGQTATQKSAPKGAAKKTTAKKSAPRGTSAPKSTS